MWNYVKLFKRDQQTESHRPSTPGSSARIEPPLVALGDSKVLIGELLEQSELVDAAVIARMVASQVGTGRRLGSLLVEHQLITEEELATALSVQLGVPELDVRQIVPAEEALLLLNETIA